MTIVRAVVASAGVLLLSGPPASADDLSSYRDYVLGSSLASVITTTRARAPETRTLHERPAKIQELVWRAPYVRSGDDMADPVRQVAFTFYDDQLYQIVVTYDADRTEGLTDSDVIGSLSATYGVPLLASTRARTAPAVSSTDGIVLARWTNVTASVTLLRGAYSPDFQLVLHASALNTRARIAVAEAIRLDTIEAPRRALEQREEDAAAAAAAREQARTTNKAAFRP